MRKTQNRPTKYAFESKINFEKLETLQVNLGNMCNNHCKHCHMNAGPNGKNLMSVKIMDDVLQFLEKNLTVTLDITGGSPEMHPAIKYLIKTAARKTKKIISRTNLTVLAENPYHDMIAFFRENKVTLIASLPCYTKQNVEFQRGIGSFDTSIEVLKKLNEQGYGKEKDLELNIAYNPIGDYLPSDQKQLENDYKKHLKENYNIVFDNLITITNMPLGRFETMLKLGGKYDDYMKLLTENFRRENLKSVMCKTLVSVGWEGNLYNCDFNQACRMPVTDGKGRIIKSTDLLQIDKKQIKIEAGPHCYACVAGNGSGCMGSLSDAKNKTAISCLPTFV